MKKSLLLRIVGAVLVMAVGVSSIGVAVGQESPGQIEELPLPALAVDVPRVAQVNELVTITVTDRGSGMAVEGASVYAFGRPVRSLLGTSDTGESVGPLAGVYKCVGETDVNGRVTSAFDKSGALPIIATMEGYVPGLAQLIVKPKVMGRLEIEAPRLAEVDQPVAIRVIEETDGEAVSGVEVWAVKFPVRDWIRELMPSTSSGEVLQGNVTGMLDRFGVLLGQTGGDGSLEPTPTFAEAGVYLLVAINSDYVPDLEPLIIVANRALAIEAPRSVGADEEVTFTVTTRGLGTPVEGVELYAVSAQRLWPIPIPWPEATEGQCRSLGEMAVERGEHIGTTDAQGQVTDHKFMNAGRYLILGVKDGYVPGFASISVGRFGFFWGSGERGALPRFEQLRERVRERLWG